MFNSRSTSKMLSFWTKTAAKNCAIKKVHICGLHCNRRFVTPVSSQNLTRYRNFRLERQLSSQNNLENDEDDGEVEECETNVLRTTAKRDEYIWSSVQKYAVEDQALSLEQCEELRKECINCATNERIVDGGLLKCFLEKSQIRAGYSYLKFLFRKNLFNPASVVLTSKLIYKAHRLGIAEQSFVLKFYEEVLNGKFADVFWFSPLPHFYCLGSTSRWREAVEILKKPEHLISTSAQTLMLTACLDHKEPDMALDLTEKWASNEKTRAFILGGDFHDTFLHFLLDKSKKNPSEAFKYFVRYVQLMGRFHCQELPKHLEPVIKAVFENINPAYRVNRTTIGRRNLTCSCCLKSVEPESFKSEEYEMMKKVVIAEILEGDDVFRTSSPAELKMFRKFVETNAPFDLVFDGLNLIIGGKGRRLGTEARTKIAVNTIRNIARITNAKKTCIVVRAHLFNELPEVKAELKRIGCILTLQDKSSDDPFILYAALASGPRSYVVSKDYFTFLNHVTDPNVRLLLRRWKRTRVIGEWDESHSGHLRITVPPSFAFRYQFNGTSFHIPLYEKNEKVKTNQSEIEPSSTNSWLCISKPNK